MEIQTYTGNARRKSTCQLRKSAEASRGTARNFAVFIRFQSKSMQIQAVFSRATQNWLRIHVVLEKTPGFPRRTTPGRCSTGSTPNLKNTIDLPQFGVGRRAVNDDSILTYTRPSFWVSMVPHPRSSLTLTVPRLCGGPPPHGDRMLGAQSWIRVPKLKA